MKSKKSNLENEVIKCIVNKHESNPFINIDDVAAHLFLVEKIDIPTSKKMGKKYAAKKHLVKSIVEKLIKENKAKIENDTLGSIVLTK